VAKTGTVSPRPALRQLRHTTRTLVRLARLERLEYAGALHPSMWRRGFLSSRLYAYPGIEDPSVPYINDLHVHLRSHTLNSPAAQLLLRHKHVFADALEARGLAGWAPQTYGTVTARGFHARSPEALDRFLAQDTVVLKPTSGLGGSGVQVVPAHEVGDLVAEPGEELLVQERLVQHPGLRPISPGSLNTARLLTVRLPEHGPEIAAASHRWGTARSWPVDNVSSGGLSCGVDVQTGRMGPIRESPRSRRRVEHDRHPDTGVQIAGVLVPHWGEVRDLARRLMAAFPELDHVGWDIAVTDRGPRVVEGNANMPALFPFQMEGSYLQDPGLRDYYIRSGMLSARHAGERS
jgi:hypothetical protein